MIVDVHSHAWKYCEHFSEDLKKQNRRISKDAERDLSARYEKYCAKTDGDVKSIVFGGKAKMSGLWVPDEYVADYVKQAPNKLIGFLSLDPTQPRSEYELKKGHQEFGLRGINLMPAHAGIGPDHPGLNNLWRYATESGLPLFLHNGAPFVSHAKIEYGSPMRVDNLAVNFPELKIIIAGLAHPFERESAAIIRKHKNVFADVGALHLHPWQAYSSLMSIQEYGVWDKLFFGTDYPFSDVNESLNGLRRINNMLEGTALPHLNLGEIEKMIYRDSLSVLGLK